MRFNMNRILVPLLVAMAAVAVRPALGAGDGRAQLRAEFSDAQNQLRLMESTINEMDVKIADEMDNVEQIQQDLDRGADPAVIVRQIAAAQWRVASLDGTTDNNIVRLGGIEATLFDIRDRAGALNFRMLVAAVNRELLFHGQVEDQVVTQKEKIRQIQADLARLAEEVR